MQERTIPFCGYYGSLEEVPLKGLSIGWYCVDDLYTRLLAKHEEKLIKMQAKLMTEFREKLEMELDLFRRKLTDRLQSLDDPIKRKTPYGRR